MVRVLDCFIYSQSPITGRPITGKCRYPDRFVYSIAFDIRIRISNSYSVSGYGKMDGSITELVRLSDSDCSDFQNSPNYKNQQKKIQAQMS